MHSSALQSSAARVSTGLSRGPTSVIRSVASRCLWPALVALAAGGCPPSAPEGGAAVFNNTTDPTNGGAAYIGSAACAACHPDLGQTVFLHAHSQALHRIEGQQPGYPNEPPRGQVPDPPAGRTWSDISYVIGGYLLDALFVDADGFVLTDGVAGVQTQWNLALADNGTPAGFVPYLPDQSTPLPYSHDCFRCHTTGPREFGVTTSQRQDNRPGIGGTWSETGVQCEACHGPGSDHPPNPAARNLFVDATAQTCARCHTSGNDPTVIPVADGFIVPNAQFAELRASGGHAEFNCTICHDPHVSAVVSDAGIRNRCTACHTDVNMALHAGKVYRRGGYTEPLECQSCHMPYATRTASSATPAVVGAAGRMGDTRTHIFRIDTRPVPYPRMLTASGSAVRIDALGRAAVTVDFVCLRCHNAIGSAFELTLEQAAEIASVMHQF